MTVWICVNIKRHTFLQIETLVFMKWEKVLENIIPMQNMLATMSHSITMTSMIVIKAIVIDDNGNSLFKCRLINQIRRTENSGKWLGKRILERMG